METLARKTGSMAAVVFAVKSVFGCNLLVLMSSYLHEVLLACEDRFTAINSGQIRGGAVQVTASVRRFRGRKVDLESCVAVALGRLDALFIVQNELI